LIIDECGLAYCLYCTKSIVGAVTVPVGVKFLQSFSPANEKQGPIPEEMLQTLLTNKKQGNLD
jgi:hypothetical protein